MITQKHNSGQHILVILDLVIQLGRRQKKKMAETTQRLKAKGDNSFIFITQNSSTGPSLGLTVITRG